jgi:hypothetical protein
VNLNEMLPRKAVLLAVDAKGRQIVSLHIKQTFAFNARGKCVLAEDDEQVPLFFPRPEPRAPWHVEMDVLPLKHSTDMIVHALAYGHGARECEVSIAVGGRKIAYNISGDRRCIYAGPGSIRFSEADRFDAIPICYENAYGGVDDTVAIPDPKTLMDCFRRHPGAYPRNTEGRGYVIAERREALDGLLLPNVQHPKQLLTPDNIIVGAPENWWRQPLPWSCDWFAKSWYPRASFLAGPPVDMPVEDHEVAEVRLGWVEAGQQARTERTPLSQRLDSRYFDAASPALVVPFIRANERIELVGMTREESLVIELPGLRPRMEVRFEGRMYQLEPVLNRVVLSVEEERLSIVWHGSWHPPRELPDRLPREGDCSTMELEGVEAFIDGLPLLASKAL